MTNIEHYNCVICGDAAHILMTEGVTAENYQVGFCEKHARSVVCDCCRRVFHLQDTQFAILGTNEDTIHTPCRVVCSVCVKNVVECPRCGEVVYIKDTQTVFDVNNIEYDVCNSCAADFALVRCL